MVSNRVKRNIWGALTISGVGIIISRTIDVATGGDWWQLISAVIIFGCCLRFFLTFNNAVKAEKSQGEKLPE